LARRAWGAALAAGAVSPALLTKDLGRPERFLNMLRMFKVTSPMSVGSWVLSATGTTIGIAAANAWLGRFPRLAEVARPGAALLGMALTLLMKRRLGNHAEAFANGAPRHLEHASRALIAAGSAVLARRGGSSRTAAILGGALLSAGAMSARWSIFKAGFAS